MYVPFGKSVDDITIRFSLRHHFWPRLKKTMEHNLCLEILHKNPPHSYPILGNFVYMYLKELTVICDI